MKKQIVLFMVAMLVTVASIMAQSQGGPRMTVEERVKVVNEKFRDFKLAPDKLAKTDSIYFLLLHHAKRKRSNDELWRHP